MAYTIVDSVISRLLEGACFVSSAGGNTCVA